MPGEVIVVSVDKFVKDLYIAFLVFISLLNIFIWCENNYYLRRQPELPDTHDEMSDTPT